MSRLSVSGDRRWLLVSFDVDHPDGPAPLTGEAQNRGHESILDSVLMVRARSDTVLYLLY